MFHPYILLSLLGASMASKWILDSVCNDDVVLEKALIASFQEAVKISGIAADVLERDLQNPRVQSMVNHVLGPSDGPNFQENIETAKFYFRNVAKYDKEETGELDTIGGLTNEDVRIYCDRSNWGPGPRVGTLRNIHTETVKAENEVRLAMEPCFNKKTPDPGTSIAVAITTSSNIIDWAKYLPEYNNWDNGGRVSAQPSVQPFSAAQPGKENTMNICLWYLEAIKDAKNKDVFYGIDDSSIARVREPGYIASLPSNTKPFDVLKESMGGLLIHELTHTNLGGLSIDDGRAGSGGCYGWDCVGKLHNIHNADSVSVLAVCMYLFTKGFWVDTDGMLQTV